MLRMDFKDKSTVYQMIVSLAAVTLIVIGCIIILKPFFPAMLLSVIFTLATWPAFKWILLKSNHRIVLASTLMTLLLAACFVAPIVVIGTSVADNYTKVYDAVQTSLQGDPQSTANWLTSTPYIGEYLQKIDIARYLDKAYLSEILQKYFGETSKVLVNIGGAIGSGLLDITLGVIISYFLFRHGAHAAERINNLIQKFVGNDGKRLLDVSKNTLTGVVYGLLGTALAQGVLATIGFWIADVPGATFLGFATFFLSLIPIGPPLVWGSAALWLFSENHHYMAGFLVLWGALIIGSVDNIMKPYFISRGSNLPLLLVLLGIMGGVLAFGFIGVFIGPTLLALAYSLLLEWSSVRKEHQNQA